MIFVILFIAIAAAIIQFASSVNDILIISQNGKKKISRKGWVYIVCLIFLIICPIIQYLIQINEDAKKEKIAKEKQDKRDSIQKVLYDSSILAMKKNYDESNDKTISILSENLGKYGYQFDSANKQLIKLVKDSAKTRVIEPENPSLILSLNRDDQGIQFVKNENGLDIYKIVFESKNASSSYFKLSGSVVARDSLNNLVYNYRQDELIQFNYIIAKDDGLYSYISIEDTLLFQYLYIWIRGEYQTVEKNKRFNFDNVYFYNKQGGTFGPLKGESRKQIIAFCKSNELLNY